LAHGNTDTNTDSNTQVGSMVIWKPRFLSSSGKVFS